MPPPLPASLGRDLVAARAAVSACHGTDLLDYREMAAEMLVRAGTSLLFVCAEPVPGAAAEATPSGSDL
jgi:hypothetical protein